MEENTTTLAVPTRLRNGQLPDLVEMLKAQHDVKYDIVVPASKLRSVDGVIGVIGGAVRWDGDGATEDTAWLQPTDIFDDAIGDRLNIPRAYTRRMRAERVDLLDANINGWLREDDRSFLLRGFRTDDPDQIGIARTLLSDRFKALDNYDFLFATLEGIREAGVEVNITGAELSERRMNVKVAAPAVEVLAPELLKGYRSPFDNASPERQAAARAHGWIEPDKRPVVFAGFVLGNSETGGGAFTITPRIIVKVCTNGLVMTRDAVREIHLGGKLDEGIIRWSADTQAKSLALVKAKTVDAVRTFLDVEYVRRAVTQLEEKAGRKVDEPRKTIERLTKSQTWSESEADSILMHFLSSGQMTAGGIMQAVTATAQVVESPDRAHDLELSAVALLDAAFN
jgi:hypothetical protein